MDAVSGSQARIARVNGPLVEVTGLTEVAMYDIVELGEHLLPGEAVALSGDVTTVQAYEYTGGLAPGHPARSRGEPLSARLGPHLLGGIFDGLLRPLADAPAWLEPGYRFRAADDQEFEFTPQAEVGATVGQGDPLGSLRVSGGTGYRVLVPPGVSGTVDKVREAGPAPGERRDRDRLGHRRAPDLQLAGAAPAARPSADRRHVPAAHRAAGHRRAVPRGQGRQLCRSRRVRHRKDPPASADHEVVRRGRDRLRRLRERGNELADMLAELAELSDPRTGGKLAARTVVIANTSNMPMMAREASIYSAAAVAEHFRDMGLDVVVVADSTSRWAEALREFASRSGDLPAEEGYPASLSSALAAFYERAGRVVTSGGYEGSVTIIGVVSPADGDMTEPVTAYTQRFVRSLWSLDRDLAYARHYPPSPGPDRSPGTLMSWPRGKPARGILAGPAAGPGWPRCSPKRTGSARWPSSWAPPPCRPGNGPRSWRGG
jgi:V/A-type H+/Na+-transporting ATPase subunit A